MNHDVVVVGGGPAGLAAALALGRARRRVLFCDAGRPRNAAAVHVQNFVTRDGIAPAEFRRIAREQLARYPNIDSRDVRVDEIRGGHGAFQVRLESGTIGARRVLLCTGVIDDLPAIEGFRALWGTSIFACPYCHGWEVQDRRFAYLAPAVESVTFSLLLRAWSSDVIVLTDGRFAVPPEMLRRLADGGVHVEDATIARLRSEGQHLNGIEFATGRFIERDVLFAHPRQHQVDLVRDLGLVLDERGYVRVDEATRETSVPGVHAAGDLLTSAQSAVLAAASGMQAAAAVNLSLAMEMPAAR